MPQHKPAFILKNAGKKKLNFNPLGNLLLIEHGYTKSDATYDKKFFFIQYLKNQQKFINHLDKKPRKKLIVRLFNIHYQNKELHEESRWFDFDPNIKIDKGISKIDTLISKSRLVVHSYDSTGILETLSDNIPTLAFWGPEVALVDSAKPYYQLLIDAGIVHLSAKSVADKINEIWDDIDSWWKQSNVQNARIQFIHRYAKKSQKPITELKQILLS
jgi:putative transferase (TIGR04331 family)